MLRLRRLALRSLVVVPLQLAEAGWDLIVTDTTDNFRLVTCALVQEYLTCLNAWRSRPPLTVPTCDSPARWRPLVLTLWRPPLASRSEPFNHSTLNMSVNK
eukprot:6113747-Pyramimonas_sp.AAC.1